MLEAWLLTEACQPGELPDLKNNIKGQDFLINQKQQRKKVQTLKTDQILPWSNKYFELNPAVNKDEKKHYIRQFNIYGACYPKYYIERFLKSHFKNTEDVINEARGTCFSYVMTVDENGRVIDETINVPMIATVLKTLKEKGQLENVTETHQKALEDFEAEVSELVSENKLDQEILKKINQAFTRYFYVFPHIEHGHNNYFSIEKVREGMASNQFFNSFYIKDLEKIKEYGLNDTLKDFINGVPKEDRKDIDDNPEYIEKILEPKNLPDGRWPSLVEHRLSLMQQVAVNQISTTETTISSVNGPPGTGKTTLLKDLFADLVVKRAEKMLQFDQPSKAIVSGKLHSTDQYTTYQLAEELQGFKMVVASSNNGAVENISNELPLKEEIARFSYNSNDHTLQFPDYEKQYTEVAKDLEELNRFSEAMTGKPSWGLFSGVFGKKDNIDKVMKVLQSQKDKEESEPHTLADWLMYRSEETAYKVQLEDWNKARKDFKNELQIVRQLKEAMQEGYQLVQEMNELSIRLEPLKDEYQEIDRKIQQMKQEEHALANKVKQLKSEEPNWQEHIDDLSIQEEALPKENFIKRIIHSLAGETTAERQRIKNKKAEVIKEKQSYRKEIEQNKQQLSSIEKKKGKQMKRQEKITSEWRMMKSKETELERFKEKNPDVTVPDSEFWLAENYDQRQETVLWISDELQFHRGLLFIRAMILHKHLLIANAYKVKRSLDNLAFSRKDEVEKKKHAWEILHLITSVISTTFASLGRMYEEMPQDFIDYLFIDEAGQAVPQAAAGALWRSKKAIVVGDPIQIEPVFSLEASLIDEIRKSHAIDERLLSIESSVQSIADQANFYGTMKNPETWLGIPLWVHRRCVNPMFDIANKIAYENKMVLPSYVKEAEKKDQMVRSYWYDIKGKATHKQFVPEQQEKIIELLTADWKNNSKETPDVYVITPFTAIKSKIQSAVKKMLVEKLKVSKKEASRWVESSIGTVHTFQGKEAEKVYFVIGTDASQKGAANWSCMKPNILNVAVTRAEKEFHIIGDYQRFKTLNFYQTIAQYSQVVK